MDPFRRPWDRLVSSSRDEERHARPPVTATPRPACRVRRGVGGIGSDRSGRFVAVVGAVVVASALIAPAALGLWSTTRDVSADGWETQDSPTVAVDRQGDRLLVWVACDGTLPYCYHQVQARTMPLGREMGSIRNLSPMGPLRHGPRWTPTTTATSRSSGNRTCAWWPAA
jgi:hypothetical protein